MNFQNLDSTTMIAGVLGAFFLIVAIYKTFGRRTNSQLYTSSSQKPQKEEETVKLSDPFAATKPDSAKPEKAELVTPPSSSSLSEKSAFAQYAPDASGLINDKIRDDSDYHWE